MSVCVIHTSIRTNVHEYQLVVKVLQKFTSIVIRHHCKHTHTHTCTHMNRSVCKLTLCQVCACAHLQKLRRVHAHTHAQEVTATTSTKQTVNCKKKYERTSVTSITYIERWTCCVCRLRWRRRWLRCMTVCNRKCTTNNNNNNNIKYRLMPVHYIQLLHRHLHCHTDQRDTFVVTFVWPQDECLCVNNSKC